ncbi:HDL208Wp [Eremothecium sinecaudum]|uniref:Carbonic anhydrase n=1 Tax=Eremothecium sinecaudum TaxID=45286 RepID=A0A109UWZ5_9SACH|nr:HDL208Wp [Eremothecium sinecaudum]AMD20536.1 HDL208Wp [Eremothecium sinecaudum]
MQLPVLTSTLSNSSTLEDILNSNARWREGVNGQFPDLFEVNGKGQSPHTLFIGCADSRYNENCLGVLPGEVFTYKNIANVVNLKDVGFLAVIEFAINVLKVSRIIICGHTDCGGIKAGIVDEFPSDCGHLREYLQETRDIYEQYRVEVENMNLQNKVQQLASFNVEKQYQRLLQNDTVRQAVKSGQLEVYPLIYDVGTGFLEVVSVGGN